MYEVIDSFIIKDKYELSDTDIDHEASCSAARRAELLGYRNFSVRRANVPVYSENEFRCYTFEIYKLQG